MKLAILLSCLISGLLFRESSAQIFVDNFSDFKTACTSAKPGDEIVLAAGRYAAESITISELQGTAENPVIIRAEHPGADTLDEGTFFDLRHCSYITIQGFVINITEKSTTFKIQTCNNIRITQNILDGSGEAYYKDDGVNRNSSVWVSIQGLWDDPTGLSHHNRIDHNLFRNKHTLGNMVRIDGTDQKYVSRYDVIEYNYFKNMGPRAENEMETIRIGWSAMSESDSYCTVSFNLFEECNGDPEIISVKCNKNTLSHNTFRRCQGTLSLRHGNASLAEGNFFLGQEAEGTGGVRIYGSDHRIINNYFEGLTGTRWDAPIALTYGDAEEGSTNLTKHFRIERAVIANNTLVNNYYGIEIGYDNNDSYTKPPRDVVLAYNLVASETGTLATYINPPDNMTWENNLFHVTGSATLSQGISFATGEILDADPELVWIDSLTQYRATPATPTYSPVVALTCEIEHDIDGQPRSATTNYGADENQEAEVIYFPLTPADVGPELGDYLQTAVGFLSLPVSGGTVYVNLYSNLDWMLSCNASWLSTDRQAGSGDASIRISVEKNESGAQRTATINITTTNAEDGKEKSAIISISQAESDPPFLNLDKESLGFTASGGSQTITVSSNTDWSVSTNENWIRISPANGTGTDNLIITAEENPGRSSRHGNIIVSDKASLETVIAIRQDGSVGSEGKLVIIAATASTEQTENGNIAANVYDGKLDNRWSGEGDGAFIDLRLEKVSVVSFIKAGLFKGDERYCYFDIQTSLDGIHYFNALMDITAGMTTESLIILDIPDTSANFVRITGHGNSTSAWNSFTEFEAWGWEKAEESSGIIKLQNKGISLYPNPSEGSFTLQSSPGSLVEIRDISGRILWNQIVSQEIELLNTGLQPGIYLISVSNWENSKTEIILIK